MKRIALVLMAVMLLCTGVALAGARGTPAEAQAMLDEAVKFFNAKGKDATLAEINNPAGKFVKGDIYVFAIDSSGNTLAHGANQKLVGKNLMEVKDADGKLFMKEIVETGKKGGGTVEYKWTNPESKKTEAKIAYIKTVGGIVLGCGAYK